MLREEGLENVFARHQRHAAATRAAVRGWGLEVLCADEREHSGSLTAVIMPDGRRRRVRKIILERFDMSLGAGLGKLAGRVFRIGHLGDFNDLMLMGTLCGVEMGLRLAGVPVAGSGVEAAHGAARARAGLGVSALGRACGSWSSRRSWPGRSAARCSATWAPTWSRSSRSEGDSTRQSMGAAVLPRRQPQQALDRARPQVGGAPGRLPPAGARRRRRARELPPRRGGASSAPAGRAVARSTRA